MIRVGISVRIEDENGQPAGELLDPRNHLGRLLSLPECADTVCLRFIDPYGDTVFNQLQLPCLIADLEAVRSKVTDHAIRRASEEALQAARSARWAESIIRAYEESVERASAHPIIEHIDALVVLARKARADGSYLKFYGD